MEGSYLFKNSLIWFLSISTPTIFLQPYNRPQDNLLPDNKDPYYNLTNDCPSRNDTLPKYHLNLQGHLQRNIKILQLMFLFCLIAQDSHIPFLTVQEVSADQVIIQVKASEIADCLHAGTFHFHGNTAFRFSFTFILFNSVFIIGCFLIGLPSI